LASAKESNTPPEILERIQNVINELRQGRASVDKQRSRSLTTQNRVGVQDARIAGVLRAISQAREHVLDRLFLRDGAPLWGTAPSFPAAHKNCKKKASARFLRNGPR
jgi:hypothetical protein